MDDVLSKEYKVEEVDALIKEVHDLNTRLGNSRNDHREISMIQDKFDSLVQQINDRKEFLIGRLEVVEKTHLIMNILKYKTYEIRYQFRKLFDELKTQKQKLKNACDKTLNELEIAEKLVEIETTLKEENKNLENQLQSIKEQTLETQTEYENAANILDSDLTQLIDLYTNLLAVFDDEKKQSTPSQVDLLNERCTPILEELKKDIDYMDKLQISGWKILYAEEELSDLLDEKGLKVTKEGLVITNSGRLITYKEAKDMKCLGDIDIDLLSEYQPKSIKSSSTTSSKKMSKYSSSTERSSVYSKMSSDDVNYLKENLGKPLTLALAEITAVQPKDPIHYLGHWLFKFRYNQELDDVQKVEIDALTEERTRTAKEKWKIFLEEEAKSAVMEMIMRAEEQAMMNELKRIADEAAALEEEEEQENDEEDEARDVLGVYNGPPTNPNLST